jgi:predicted membrane protein
MNSKLIFGSLLVLLGLGFLVEEFTGWDFGKLVGQLWPLVLVVVGGYGWIKANFQDIGSLVVLTLGAVFLLFTVDVLEQSAWEYVWPVVLIVIGLHVLLPRTRKKGGSSDSQIDYFAAFGGREDKVHSKDFQGGQIVSLFGGVELDLSQAQMQQEEVELEVASAFGGSALKVPKTWKVVINGMPIFGGWENNTEPENPDKTLSIKATVVFGGVEVKN